MFPLHLAALSGFSDCCRKLLSSGKWNLHRLILLFLFSQSIHPLFNTISLNCSSKITYRYLQVWIIINPSQKMLGSLILRFDFSLQLWERFYFFPVISSSQWRMGCGVFLEQLLFIEWQSSCLEAKYLHLHASFLRATYNPIISARFVKLFMSYLITILKNHNHSQFEIKQDQQLSISITAKQWSLLNAQNQ